MISRKTARVITETYEEESAYSKPKYYSGSGTHGYETTIYTHQLYDFLYDNDYPSWLLNQTRKLVSYRRAVQDWIMKLHTGETQYDATPNWSWDKRRQLGQQYLEELAEDMIIRLSEPRDQHSESKWVQLLTELAHSLELDGYLFRGGVLLRSESDVLDLQEEQGVLQALFSGLGLANAKTAFHHLSLSEEHYVVGWWDDSISNSGKSLESGMQEVAATHSERIRGTALAENVYTRPVAVRDY
jgi:hypothetical protein